MSMDFVVRSIEKVIEVPLDEAFGYLFCVFAGIVANWLWKCKREKINVKDYWTDNLISTGYTFAGAIAMYITTLIAEPGVGKIAYFTIGMAADSLLNKPPLPAAVRVALERLENLQNANDTGIVDPTGKVINPVVSVPPDGMLVEDSIDDAARNAVTEAGKHFAGCGVAKQARRKKGKR